MLGVANALPTSIHDKRREIFFIIKGFSTTIIQRRKKDTGVAF
jgi:hypothetical protein